jgi:hypothetical protein
MEGCTWDPEKEMVIGLYDEEISYLEEADPMKDILKETSNLNSTSSKTASTTSNTEFTVPNISSFTSPTFGDNDEDSVSTIGNSIHQRWNPTTKEVTPQTPKYSSLKTRNDDKSTSTVSTLTTRLTTMEVQYQQISGDVQDIKNLLAVLAKSSTQHSAQDEAPTNANNAGQSSSLAGEGS